MKDKKKDAMGSPHRLHDQKKRGKVKVKDQTKVMRDHAPMDSRRPNHLNRPGNDADREMETLRDMDRKKQMLQRTGKKKKGGY